MSKHTCPDCGEPVGERAVYCMHCGAEFGDDGPGADGGLGAEVSFDAGESSTSDASEGTDTPDAVGADTRTASAADAPGRGDLLDRLFHPEGLLDDSLTVVIGVGVGLLCGVAALFVFAAVAGGVGLLAGLVAFVGVTGWLARQYSLFGAVRGGCYALAVAVLLLPVVALTDAAKGGTFGGQILLFLVGELVFALLALPLAGVGYVAGKRRPEAGRTGSAGTQSNPRQSAAETPPTPPQSGDGETATETTAVAPDAATAAGDTTTAEAGTDDGGGNEIDWSARTAVVGAVAGPIAGYFLGLAGVALGLRSTALTVSILLAVGAVLYFATRASVRAAARRGGGLLLASAGALGVLAAVGVDVDPWAGGAWVTLVLGGFIAVGIVLVLAGRGVLVTAFS